MPSRVEALEQTLAAYRDTHVPLVQYVRGQQLAVAGYSDDPGIYLVLPRLAGWLHLSPAETLATLLLVVAWAAALSGIAGWFVYTRDRLSRLYAIALVVLVTGIALEWGDVYVMLSATVFALVPWMLVLTRGRRIAPGALPWLFGLGLLSGASNVIRSQSGTAVVLFGVLLVALYVRESPALLRAAAAGLLIAGMLVPQAGLAAQVRARDAFLASRSDALVEDRAGHPIWHSVYIGLGFIPNRWVPEYRDEVAIAKVAEIDPGAGYLSVRYERALRDEVVRLVRTQPLFVARVLAVKALQILGYLLVFLNIGLVALVFSRQPLGLHASFVAALFFESLFGLLVVPERWYLFGLFAFAAVYAMVGVDSFMAARKAAASAGTG